jgi:flavin reductase (DIM6/NTAB) family NADH-FMN oxidoreductase RutF
MKNRFTTVKRQSFRIWFQPSRVVILSIFDDQRDRFNLTTLCFSMHSEYKPPSVAFSVEKRHLSHELLTRRGHFALGVPGRCLATAALSCGLKCGREVDKANVFGVRLEQGTLPSHMLVADAIANMECELAWFHDAGDHTVFNARVTRYLVCKDCIEPGLLSIGSDETGYEVLCVSGVHKLAVPAQGCR